MNQDIPQNVEAEEAVLGSILIDPTALLFVRKIITPADFFIVRNGWIFDAMLSLKAFGRAIDFVTLAAHLKEAGRLDEIGGAAYLSRLINSVPTAINAVHYAEAVMDCATSRALLRAASEIAKAAFDPTLDAEQRVSTSRAILNKVRSGDDSHLVSIGSVAVEMVGELERWADTPLSIDQVRGLSSGFPSIDKLTGGFMPQEMTVLAARTGIGKSALAFEIARSIAERGVKTAIFSIEMNRKVVGYRLISKEVGVSYQDMLRGWMNTGAWRNIYQALERLEHLPLYINDRSKRIASIEADVSSLNDCQLFVVDHLRLIRDKEKNESEVLRLGRLSMELRQIARDTGAHCLLITQLNRGIEGRDDKRPTLADIRQSGEIEENADSVWGMYRSPQDKSIMCISPLKNRNGEAGVDVVAELKFNAEYMHFERVNHQNLNEPA